MFKTVKDAIDWIESVKRFGDKLDLSRMEIACKLLNHPERNLNVIHIAGTNGKGSTVSYLKHILLEHGYHVGTFTSPYIVRFNERITYDYNDISDDELLFYINRELIKDVSYGSHTKFNYKNESYKLSMLGTHQVFNACLALEVLFELQEMKLVILDMNNVKLGLLKTYWPGRLEQFGNIYLDGAHNVGGATALRNSIQEMFKDKYIKVLYATMADKEYFDVIDILDPVVDEIYFTEFDYPRCEKAIEAYHICSSIGAPNHSQKFVADNAINIYKDLKKSLKSNEILLVTGSLYFVSYMRKEL